MDLNQIYPPIEFPVSRGTPMISSLIEWDHSESFFYMRHEFRICNGERVYPVTLADIDYEYIAGHTIDGSLQDLLLRIFALNCCKFIRSSAFPSNWLSLHCVELVCRHDTSFAIRM